MWVGDFLHFKLLTLLTLSDIRQHSAFATTIWGGQASVVLEGSSGGPLETYQLFGDGFSGFTELRALSRPGFHFCHSSLSVSLADTPDAGASTGA